MALSVKSKNNLAIFGCGNRVKNTILPALHNHNEVNLKHVISRAKDKIISYKHNQDYFYLKTSNYKNIDFSTIDYIYLAVPSISIYKILIELVNNEETSRINLLLDTPPIDLIDIYRISIFKKFKSVNVMEESPFTPEFIEIKKFLENNDIGNIEKIFYFHSGYLYHAFSQIKNLFDVQYFNFILKKRTSRFTEEIKIFNSSKNIATIYGPRDYSVGRYLIINSRSYLDNYNFSLKAKNNLSYFLKHNYKDGIYNGFQILKGKHIIMSYVTDIKYKLYEDNKLSQIHMIMKEIGVRDYFTEIIKSKNKYIIGRYLLNDALYDYIASKIITRFGFFFDIRIPFTSTSLIRILLEFISKIK